MTQRKLLYLPLAAQAPRSTTDLGLESWHIIAVEHIAAIEPMIQRDDVRVGLIDFGDTFLNLHTQVEKLLGSKLPVEWVALLPSHGLQHKAICQLIRDYFFAYHTLPVDRQRLDTILGHAYGMASLGYSLHQGEDGLSEDEHMVGSSACMLDLFRNIRKVANVDAPVLITGEIGTGKELTTRAVHERSSRSAKPFVAVNCGALPASLIQTELFGHEKGAFTGAHQRRIGRIEAASEDTILLDEIGDLSLDLQVNLLRFLQEQNFQRVGGCADIQADVRVVAATHVNLEEAVEAGRFREDLYYRLNVLHLKVPALRERGRDVELLARFFLNKFSAGRETQAKGFAPDALLSMARHHWPGNVRELINRVRRAIVMGENRFITAGDLGLDPINGEAEHRMHIITLDQAREAAEKVAIASALRQSGYNVSHAAKDLDVSRVTLYRLMEKLRIHA